MRELPLKDEEWVRSHLKLVQSFFNSKLLTNLQLLLPFSDMNKYDLQLFHNKLEGKTILLKDLLSGEIFKYIVDLESSNDFKTTFKKAYLKYCYLNDDFQLISTASFHIDVSIEQKEYKLPRSPRSIIIDGFLEKTYDLSLLKSSRKTILHDYIVQKIPDVDTRSYNMDISDILENEEAIYEEEFINIIRAKYIGYFQSEIENQLKNYRNIIDIKYTLLRSDTRFSGTHKVIFNNYNENKNRSGFDTIDVELNMLEDYNANLEYIKENMRSVKSLIVKILKSNNRCKDYVNFLKMYSLILTRENTLVARFCFKDGLEELLTEEDKNEI